MSFAHYLREYGCRAIVVMCVLIGMPGCAALDRRPAPSLDELVRMSADGKSDEEIITLLRESRAVYPLSASRIIELNESGMSTAVLDYLQQAYIESVRRQERLLYGDPLWVYPCIGCGYPHRHIVPYYVYPY